MFIALATRTVGHFRYGMISCLNVDWVISYKITFKKLGNGCSFVNGVIISFGTGSGWWIVSTNV